MSVRTVKKKMVRGGLRVRYVDVPGPDVPNVFIYRACRAFRTYCASIFWDTFWNTVGRCYAYRKDV